MIDSQGFLSIMLDRILPVVKNSDFLASHYPWDQDTPPGSQTQLQWSREGWHLKSSTAVWGPGNTSQSSLSGHMRPLRLALQALSGKELVNGLQGWNIVGMKRHISQWYKGQIYTKMQQS